MPIKVDKNFWENIMKLEKSKKLINYPFKISGDYNNSKTT